MKEYVARRKGELKAEIALLERKPGLTVIQVGHDAGSDSYIRGKRKDAEELGFLFRHLWFDEAVEEKALVEAILKESSDPLIDGIIVQLPLPKNLDEKAIGHLIPLDKDVDGFLFDSPFDPCTPKGIVDYLSAVGFPFDGKNAVVIGRSDIVGKPLARLLTRKNMNVTLLHSHTSEEDKKFYLAHADLVAVAIGHEAYLDGRFPLKKEAFLIDVGINRGADGKLRGDILPDRDVAYQSPVPGGVGLLTRLSLMENVYQAYMEHRK